ncbi:MAG: hypothetical protein FWE36_08685 [Erysipelotrichales bacterium]|nr:hypothetical protein [Erysipelotrichales bacterium]
MLLQLFEIALEAMLTFIIGIINILPLPTSITDILSTIIRENWELTSVQWLDSLLYYVAYIGSLAAAFIITNLKLKINLPKSSLISFIVFVFILVLFQSILFWIVFFVAFLLYIAYLVLNLKNAQPKNLI